MQKEKEFHWNWVNKLKQETFTILEMNYPDFAEMEDYERKRSWLNRLSLGLLGTDEAPAPPISN